jgi:hypothetical protein
MTQSQPTTSNSVAPNFSGSLGMLTRSWI